MQNIPFFCLELIRITDNADVSQTSFERLEKLQELRMLITELCPPQCECSSG
jgi:hypothetical protein